MVEAVIAEVTALPTKPSTAAEGEKKKRRKKIVWSVNVFTVVLYMVDPKYMLCTGKFK